MNQISPGKPSAQNRSDPLVIILLMIITTMSNTDELAFENECLKDDVQMLSYEIEYLKSNIDTAATNLAKDKVKELESQLKEASEAVDKWMHYMAAYHEASAEAELLRADLKEQREKNICEEIFLL